MVDNHDYDIALIEEEILMKYDTNPSNYEDCDCLLSLRKDMINKRVLAHQEEILPDIIAFNDALREALREMYDRAHRIWDNIKEQKDWGDDLELTAKCFLGIVYPKLHPVQGENRQELKTCISSNSSIIFSTIRSSPSPTSFMCVSSRQKSKLKSRNKE